MSELTNYLIEQRQAIVTIVIGLFVIACGIVIATVTYLDGPPRFSNIDLYTVEERKAKQQEREAIRNGIWLLVFLGLFIGTAIAGVGANGYVKATTYIEQLQGVKQ